MRRASRWIAWILLIGFALSVIGMLSYARGPKHHRGDEVGSHGTKIAVVHIVP
jgi:hypothetical protein